MSPINRPPLLDIRGELPVAGTLEIVRPYLPGGSPDLYLIRPAAMDAIEAWFKVARRMRGPMRCAHCDAVIGPGHATELGAFGLLTLVPNDGLGDQAIGLCWYCSRKPDAELMPVINRTAR